MSAPVMVVTLSMYRHMALLSAREALRTLEGFLDHLRPSLLLLTRRARSLPGTCGLSCPTALLSQASGKVTGVTSHLPPPPAEPDWTLHTCVCRTRCIVTIGEVR